MAKKVAETVSVVDAQKLVGTDTANGNGNGHGIDNRAFVIAYKQAIKEKRGLGWLAEALGAKKSSVSQKAKQLRRLGIPLPSFPKGAQKKEIDQAEVDELKALFAE
jgi:hypothetical protein